MTQTAVQWLLQAIEDKNGAKFASYYREFIQQALQMEKQQIENAYLSDRGAKLFLTALKLMDKAEKYYNTTYGGKP